MNAVIPQREWSEFLVAFTSRFSGWLIEIETYDSKTDERVVSPFVRFELVELDLEDAKNPRINILVRDGHKEIKHILFRPSDLSQEISKKGNQEGLTVVSINTVTTLRFRVAASPELVDGVA